jgi:hypothetical protein
VERAPSVFEEIELNPVVMVVSWWVQGKECTVVTATDDALMMVGEGNEETRGEERRTKIVHGEELPTLGQVIKL